MNTRKLLFLGPLAVLVLCAAALAEPKVLYEKTSAYNTVVVTEDEHGLRTLLFEKGEGRQSVVKPETPTTSSCRTVGRCRRPWPWSSSRGGS